MASWWKYLLLAPLLLFAGSTAQSCTTDSLERALGSTAEELPEGLIADALVNVSTVTTTRPTVLVLRSRTVCLATDRVRGQYRYASVVAMYNCTGEACPADGTNGGGAGVGSGVVGSGEGNDNNSTLNDTSTLDDSSTLDDTSIFASAMVTSQFDFRCVDNAWSINVNDGGNASIETPPFSATFNTILKRDCAQCLGTSTIDEEETHCIQCDRSCSDLSECTGGGSTDCCNFVDNGTCVASCMVPRDYITIESECAEPPNPMVTPAQVIASLGGSSNLTCTVEIPLGDAVLEWVMVTEEDIDSIDTNLTCTTGSSGVANTNTQVVLEDSQRLNSSGGVLQLTAIDYETAGYYVCVFESMSVTTCFSDVVSVAVRPNATVVGQGNYSFGDIVELECVVEGGPGNTFRWMQNGRTLDETTATLRMTNATFMSGGVYTCMVSNIAGNDTASQSVSVQPYFIAPPVDTGGRRMSPISLTCEVGAFPAAVYRWEKVGGNIRNGIVGVNNSTLVFQQLQLDDQGDYECIAESAGIIIRSEPATVTVAPEVLGVTSEQDTYSRGDDVTLNCSANGGPDLFFQWYFNGDSLDQNSSVLLLSSVDASDGGNYTCEASNSADNDTSRIDVFIAPYFINTPQDVDVSNGVFQNLTCVAEAFPPAEYQWVRSNGTIRTGVEGEFSTTLQFLPVVFEDAGRYYCQVASSAELLQSDIITVTVAPFAEITGSQTYNRGEDVTLTCTALGGPEVFFQWQFNGEDIPTETDPILALSSVNASDGGEYSCLTSNTAGNSSASTSVFISPYFVTIPQYVFGVALSSQTLTCVAEAFPSPSYEWSRVQNTIRSTLIGLNNETLTFDPLMFGDEGSYFCNVSSGERSIQSVVVTVTISPETSLMATPTVNSSVNAMELLVCEAEGGPGNLFQWQRMDTILVNDAEVNVTVDSASSGGDYECIVSNAAGNDSIITVINVAPRIISQSGATLVTLGGNTTISCSSEGFPAPGASWYHNGSEIATSRVVTSTVSLTATSTVSISMAMTNDSGQYVCRFTSSIVDYDPVSATIDVLVQAVPAPPTNVQAFNTGSRSTLLTWLEPHASNSRILYYVVRYTQPEFALGDRDAVANVTVENATIIDLFPGVDYVFSVTARNEIGSSAPSQPLVVRTLDEVPSSAPRNVTAIAINSTAILVRWQEVVPEDRNGNITGYEVMYMPLTDLMGSLNTTPQVTQVTSDLSIVIGDLEEFIFYAVLVRASTSAGSGNFSDPTSTQTLEDVPGSSPRNVTVTVLSPNNVTVTWNEVDLINQNGNITTYEVRYTPMNNFGNPIVPVQVNVTAPDQELGIFGLEAYVNYSISVRAYTGQGGGEFSDEVVVLTNEDRPGSPPSNVSANVLTSTSILVFWDIVPPVDQNGVITEYEVVYVPQEDFMGRIGRNSTRVPAGSRSLTLSGLEEYVNYSISVQAFTVVGGGPNSEPITRLTLEAAPSGSPQNLAAVDMSSTDIMVTWMEVEAIDRNGIIIIYEVDFQPASTFNDTSMIDVRNTTNTSILLQDLHESVQYNITVRAFTSQGPGPFSDHVISITQESTPSSAPVDVNAQALSSSQIRVMWGEVVPRDRNGMITVYEIEYEPLMDFGGQIGIELWNITVPERSVTLDQLEAFVTYNISVRAYTAIGPGPYSTPISVRTDEDRPDSSPTNVTLAVLSSTSIMVSWSIVDPIDQNGLVTGYNILYEPLEDFNGRISSNNLNSSMMSFTLTSLEMFVTYNISVSAYTSAGSGPYSSQQSATTLEDVPSNVPRNVSAVATSSMNISVTWIEIDPIDQNGIIIAYEVQYVPLNTFQGQISTALLNTSQFSVDLTQLEAYVNYSITVRARTSIGAGNYSSAVIVLTLEDTPLTSPTNVMTAATSPNSIMVSWAEVDLIDQNGVIMLYEVRYVPQVTFDGVLSNETVNVSGDRLSELLVDLEAYVDYNISVRAHTVVGPGPYSQDVVQQTLEDVPDSPPTNVQARAVSSTAINASWSEVPAIDQNGIITVYEVMYTPLMTFEGAIGTLVVNTSSMSVVLDMLQEDVDYSISVRAYTSQGPSNFSDPITQKTNQDVPAASPDNVTATVITSTSVRVNWDIVPPIQQNGPIVIYEVMYTPLETFGGQIGTLNMNSTELTLVLTDLQHDVEYNISVQAYTEIGPGPYSSPGTIVRTFEDVPDSPPTNVQARTVSSTAINVSWSEVPAIDQNGIIIVYEVMYTPLTTFEGAIGTLLVNTSSMSVVLDMLQEDVDYNISVRAYTLQGPGNFSAPITQRTNQDVPDSPPTNVQARTVSSTAINASWSEVPAIDQNGIITVYEVMYTPLTTFEGAIGTLLVNTSSMSVVLDMLQEDVDYNISVRAYTLQGPGNFSAPITQRTNQDVPDSPPTNVQARTVSSTAINASWSEVPAIDQNGIITVYEIMYTPLATFEGAIGTLLVNTSSMSVVLDMLQEDVDYNISVRAYTLQGPGNFSAPITQRTNQDEPAASPDNVTATVITSTSVRVNWDIVPPIQQNGPIVIYEVMYTPLETFGGQIGTVNVNSTQLTLVLTDLQQHVEYNISVQAYTVIGPGPYSSPGTIVRTFQDVPDASPSSVDAMADNSTSIVVNWTLVPDINRNGPITMYEIEYVPLEMFDGQVQKATVNVSDVLSVRLTNLQEYVNYTVSVRAYTVVGDGPYSSSVAARTLEDEPSSAPRNLTLMVTSSTSILVAWGTVLPIDQNGIITTYEIEYTPLEDFGGRIGTRTMNVTSASLSTVLPNLQSHVNYSVTIRAYTSIGSSSYSQPELQLTLQDEPDGYPRNVTLQVASAQDIDVSWNEVDPIDRNGVITVYEIFYQPQENYDRSMNYMNTTSLSARLSRLHEYAVYNVQVRAFTFVGPGPNSPTGSIRTATADPSASPQNVSSSNETSTSIFVSWSVIPEEDRNGVIMTYEIIFFVVDRTTNNSVQTNSGNVYSMVLDNLEQNENYTIQVRGYTTTGFGPSSSPVFSKTLQDIPGAPGVPEVPTEVNSTSVVLKWNEPEDPNGIIVNYRVNIVIISTNPLAYSRNSGGSRRRRQASVDDITLQCVAGSIGNVDRNLTTGNSMTSIAVNGLTPFTVYTFRVQAATIIGFGANFSDPQTFETSESEPEEVENLNLNVTRTSIGIAWIQPTCSFGDVRNYRVFLKTEETGKPGSEGYKVMNVPAMIERVQFYNITDLIFYTNYSIKVQAVVTTILESNLLYGRNVSGMIRTLSNADDMPTVDPALLENLKGPTSSQISFNIPDPRSIDTGRVIFVAVVVVRSNAKNFAMDPSQYDDARPFTDEAVYYITAAWDEAAVYSGRVTSTIDVGDGTIYKAKFPGMLDPINYVNQPLRSNHDYCIFVRYDILNEDPGQSLPPHRTYSASACDKTELPYSEAGLGVGIVLIIFFIVIVVVVIVLGIYFYKKKSTGIFVIGKGKDHEMIGGDERNAKVAEAEREEGFYPNPIAEQYPISTTNPVPTDEFAEHIQQLHANDNYRFTEEYSVIEPDHHPTVENTRRPENIPKNRYANITSYDHSRVHLEDTGQLGSDYVNANYMDGYRSKNYFIASQGPLPGTVVDFWRMIWEQSTTTVVMLTNLEEKGRIKCFKYWPDQLNAVKPYDEFQVTLQECLVLASYTVRTFALHRVGTKEERIIRQFHYTVWPDHGVPDEASSLLHFVRKVTMSNPASSGPMVVHCSAGVGRTGTFITLHAQLLRIEREEDVNIFAFVQEMRKRRCFMVQTEAQYVFLHDALLEAIECGVTEYSARELKDQLRKLKTTDPDTRTAYMDSEFLKLAATIHLDLTKSNACMNTNKVKNRFNDSEAIPYDRNRVRLISIPGIANSDYINASFIDGYHHRKAFIATQGPLPDTVNDFWRMVWEQKCSTIVMLTKERENGRSRCHKYWPESGALQCGYLQVIAHKQFTFSDYMVRELTLVDSREQEMPSHTVKLYQFLDWPEEGGTVPSNGTGLIDLIGQVQKWQMNSGNKPVIVHCSGGTGRTGTFIAVSVLLERLKTEGVVDVFHTVRALRLQRPRMVQTVVQYEFCYRTVLEFLESFEHYSNFK